jgi:hypothetical protein
VGEKTKNDTYYFLKISAFVKQTRDADGAKIPENFSKKPREKMFLKFKLLAKGSANSSAAISDWFPQN